MSYGKPRPKSASSGRNSPAPNSYAFTGATTAAHGGPRGPLKDAEELTHELALQKKRFATVSQENVWLRTQCSRVTAQLRKKEKHLQHVLDMKVDGLNQNIAAGGGGDAALASKLHDLRKDLVTIHRLSEQNRALEQAHAEQAEELKLLKSSMKFTLIKELQIEAETYYNEARRLKHALDAAQQHVQYLQSRAAASPATTSRGSTSSSGARALGSTSSSLSMTAAGGSGGSRPGSAKAKGSPAPAPAVGAGGSAHVPPAVEAELERLRDENKRLRMENGYLISERDEKEKGMAVLQSFRTKMAGLQSQLNEAQQLLGVDATAQAAAAALSDRSNGSPAQLQAQRKSPGAAAGSGGGSRGRK